ncbi:MAG: Stp1/IreP family PP2C-type Ser/Thr phosphatase [Clostridia bacterium]|nr:Stp1/IreP family PP2C-type Ser/Thr phosphatase [Clostridia bacterium]
MNRKFHFTKATRKRLMDFLRGKIAPAEASAPRVPLRSAAQTHVGKVRATNQDALVVSEALQLYGVADGMGGHKGGETASTGCRDAVLAALEERKAGTAALKEAIQVANAALFRQQQEDERLSGMGTTLSVIWLDEASVHIAHVGDSRVYCLRDGELLQMTDDHSLVGELMRQGVLTAEQAEKHPMRNVITRAVGTEEDICVDLATEPRRAGDIWMVCSDGLYGMVKEADMTDILRENAPEKAAELLVEAALNGGGRDNISVVVLHDEEGAQ